MATLRTPRETGEPGTEVGQPEAVASPIAVAGLPLAGGGSITGARSLRRMGRAITANRKATVGAVLLAFFILLADIATAIFDPRTRSAG